MEPELLTYWLAETGVQLVRVFSVFRVLRLLIQGGTGERTGEEEARGPLTDNLPGLSVCQFRAGQGRADQIRAFSISPFHRCNWTVANRAIHLG